MNIDRLVILGVGLIGGSLAKALRQANACKTIVGFGRSEANLLTAIQLGVIDEFSLQAKDAVREADLVVLATPLATNKVLFEEIAKTIRADTIITDVGSAKACVVEAARSGLGECFMNFVPGHPIAGKEKSGVEAANANLFEDHVVILTPLAETSIHALSLVTEMWETVGSEVITLGVEHHDAVLAATSHLPHMLAYALVDCLAKMQESEEIFQFAAGGFIDFTRIASSNPQMWHDICFSNRKSLLKVLDKFDGHMQEIRQAIEGDDSEKILQIFSRAKTARDKLIAERPYSQSNGLSE
ncbi:MAG: prephenate dehydrogenase [Planctomycetota bacterium]|jgi:prephenate dehydrogenase